MAYLKQCSSHPLFCLVGFVLLRQSWADSCQHLICKGHPPIPIWSTLWQPGLMFRRCCLENAHSIHFSFDTHTSYSNANRIYHLRLRENLKSGEEKIYSCNCVRKIDIFDRQIYSSKNGVFYVDSSKLATGSDKRLNVPGEGG